MTIKRLEASPRLAGSIFLYLIRIKPYFRWTVEIYPLIL
jgi:hypothetical protein